MDLLRVLSVLLLTLSLYEVCICDEECEIDFHIESPSVMALAGSDAGALCDASCFGHYGDLEVAWLDPAGHQIDTTSSRISAVLENGGLMSRLLIQATNRKDSGTYVCSVMRSGEILEEKPLNFYVFGDFDYQDTKIKDEGPRRGDIVPRKDFDYRPVRSLERILAGLASARSSVNLDKTRSGDLDNGIQILPKKFDKTGRIFGVSATKTDGSSVDSKIDRNIKVKNALGIKEHIPQRFDDFQTRFHLRKGGSVTRNMKSKNLPSSEMGNGKDRLHIKQIGLNKQAILNESEQPVGEKCDDGFHCRYVKRFISDLSIGKRLKRQAEMSSSHEPETTEDYTTKPATSMNSVTSESEVFTFDSSENTTTTPEVTETTENGSSDPEDRTSDPEDKTLDPEDKSVDKNESDQVTDEDDNGEANNDCTSKVKEDSNFGKYGVPALASTLAVACLILFLCVMAVLLPRVLHKTQKRADIETAGYRRKGPNDVETAPLTLLADPEVANDAQAGFENPILFDADTSLSSEEDDDNDDKGAAGMKMGDNKKESGHVTTFLLRQLSQKDSNEKQSEEVNGKTAGDADLSVKPGGDSSVSNDDNHQDGSTLHGSTINSSRHHPEHEDNDMGPDSVILV